MIYTRLIANDVLKIFIQMAKSSDPAMKPLVQALAKMETGVNLGIGAGMGFNRMINSTSILGMMAGAFGFIFDLYALVSMLIPPEDDPRGPYFHAHLITGKWYINPEPKQPPAVIAPPPPPPWIDIPFEGSGKP